MDDWERYTRVLDIDLELINDGIQFNFKMKRLLALFFSENASKWLSLLCRDTQKYHLY